MAAADTGATDAGATDAGTGPRAAPAGSLALRVVTAGGLLVDAWVHHDLAPAYAGPGGASGLFLLDAGFALAAALLVLTSTRWPAHLAAAVVAAGALTAVVVTRYVDLGPIGPLPDLYEPVWYPEKLVAAAGAAVATGGAVLLLVRAGAHGRPTGTVPAPHPSPAPGHPDVPANAAARPTRVRGRAPGRGSRTAPNSTRPAGVAAMRRRTIVITTLAAAAVAAGVAVPALAVSGSAAPPPPADAPGSGRSVIDWNRRLITILGTPGAQPPTVHPTRSFAMLQVAEYDAVVSITHAGPPYRQAVPAPDGARPDAAADQAAHDVLAALYPAARPDLDQQLAQELAAVPDGPGERDGVAVGAAAAREVVALRASDGSSATPPPFAPGTRR